MKINKIPIRMVFFLSLAFFFFILSLSFPIPCMLFSLIIYKDHVSYCVFCFFAFFFVSLFFLLFFLFIFWWVASLMTDRFPYLRLSLYLFSILFFILFHGFDFLWDSYRSVQAIIDIFLFFFFSLFLFFSDDVEVSLVTSTLWFSIDLNFHNVRHVIIKIYYIFFSFLYLENSCGMCTSHFIWRI